MINTWSTTETAKTWQITEPEYRFAMTGNIDPKSWKGKVKAYDAHAVVYSYSLSMRRPTTSTFWRHRVVLCCVPPCTSYRHCICKCKPRYN